MICRVPGCTTELTKRARVGVCGKHMHDPGHCQCSRCKRGRNDTVEEQKEYREPWTPEIWDE